MSRKLTLEYVERFFEDQGCELMEEEYVNANTKMKYRCSCSNIGEIRFNNFQQGQRCMRCSGSEKYTLKYMKHIFKEQGCELLEEDYKNVHHLMEYSCNCGNISKISFSHFKKGHRCRKCGNKKIQEGLSYEHKEVKEYFLDNDCELLEETYINNYTLMKYICNCGNTSKITFSNFKQGHRCTRCGGSEKLTLEYVYNCFKDEGCELLEKKYINCQEPMKYKCKCGDMSKISFSNFQKGRRCMTCGISKITGDNHYLWIKDRKIFKENYKFRKKCRNLLQRTLSKTNQRKIDKTYKLLGYTSSDLQNHIHNHPNWGISKNLDFHIDHIFPIKAFLDYNIKDIKLINNLDNLQPLAKRENLSKGDRYNAKEFEDWLIGTGHQVLLNTVDK